MSVPSPSSFPHSEKPPVRRKKTPPGVWVVVGIGVFFVLIALGISALIVFKSVIALKPAAMGLITATPSPAPLAKTPELGEGVQATQESPPITEATADSQEVDDTRREVLKRIDLMPELSQKDKDQLYAQVERARGFSKIAVIPFPTGKSSLGSAQIEEVIKRIEDEQVHHLLDDPTVVLVMVGYADKQGDQAKNREISRTRAEAVVKAIKDKLNPMNIMHAVGMGGQDLFGSTLDKNRVVEIWAVEP